VIVLAPHLLTQLSAELQRWLLWLGSGLAGSARPQPAALGREIDPWRAYAKRLFCSTGSRHENRPRLIFAVKTRWRAGMPQSAARLTSTAPLQLIW
jgi:hypothetical protein